MLTTHHSLLTAHYSLLTTHYALLTTHYTILTTAHNYPLLNPYRSLYTGSFHRPTRLRISHTSREGGSPPLRSLMPLQRMKYLPCGRWREPASVTSQPLLLW